MVTAINPLKRLQRLAGFGCTRALGNCGRDSYRRPGLAQLDMNILKQFKLSGNTRVQARWEIFNLFNRVNLGAPQSTNIRSSLFGTIGCRKGPLQIEITTYRSDRYDATSRKPDVAYGDSLAGDLGRRDDSHRDLDAQSRDG